MWFFIGLLRLFLFWNVKLGTFLSFRGFLYVVIPIIWIYGNHPLTILYLDCWIGRVETYLIWVVDWFFWSLFCLIFQFALFPSSKLPHVSFSIKYIFNYFLWGGSEDVRKISCINWNIVCSNKEKWGLGLGG